jgi:uncharacterized protein
MNSCLYRCEVMHHRLFPKKNRFEYSIFMFCFDLDELDILHKKLWIFSRNRFNFFTFRDKDHLQFPLGEGYNSKTVKQNITGFLFSHDIKLEDGKILLVTNTSVLGYSFNPISFYLCFDAIGNPVCAVAEVCNTHGEMKLYLLDNSCLSVNTFQQKASKNFYVSPFISLSSAFDFVFKIPGEHLHMRVDDYEDNKRVLLTSLTGQKKQLTDLRLLWYALRFPLITVKIITLIYWQAFLLYLKKIPFQRKHVNVHLQQDAHRYKNLKPTHT